MPQIISPLVVHSSGHSVSMHTLRSFNNWLIHLVSTLNKSSSAPATIWHFSNPLPSWFPSFAPAVAYQFTSSNAVWRTKYVLAVFSPGQYHFPRSGLYIHTVWDCGRVFFFFFSSTFCIFNGLKCFPIMCQGQFCTWAKTSVFFKYMWLRPSKFRKDCHHTACSITEGNEKPEMAGRRTVSQRCPYINS